MAREAMDSAGARHQSDPRLRQAQARVVGGDDDVAGERDFASAAQRKAVDRGNDRLGDVEARGDAGEAALAHLRTFAAMLGGPFEIIAGGKRALARTGQDRDPHLAVGREVVPHLVHLQVTRRLQCVHDLGAVERDVGQMAAFFVFNEFEIHRKPLYWRLSLYWRWPLYAVVRIHRLMV